MYNNEAPLQMAVVPQSFLSEIMEKMEELTTLIKKHSEEETSSTWVSSSTVRKLLGVSQKTWQTYRDKGLIPFSQIGRKIYVKRADLDTYMNAHYIGAQK